MTVLIRPRIEMRLGGPGTVVKGMWPLEEASGTRADESGNGHDLSDNNTVTQDTGIVGEAAQFTAANSEYLSVADHADLRPATSDFTIAVWVYFDDLSTSRPIVVKADPVGDYEYALAWDFPSGYFQFSANLVGAGGVNSVNASSFPDPIVTGVWYLVTAWHDSEDDTISICVNDGPVNIGGGAGTILGVFESAEPFEVGRYGAAHMDGRVDQLAVFKDFLPDAEFRTFLYNSGAGRTATEIVQSVGWVDVSEDVVSNIKADWGIHGGTPVDRVAEPGSMEFALDNSAQNSSGVRGYYSIGHDDARTGFALGVGVRLILNHETLGDKVVWQGTVEDADPLPGVRSPVTQIRCADWMEQAARAKLSGIEVQTDIQSDEVFQLLAAAVPTQPPNGILAGTGSDVYPYALDNVKDESSRVIGEFQKVGLSEYGVIYVHAGTLVFEGRSVRAGGGSIRFAFDEDEDLVAMDVSHGRDSILNRVIVSVHPRRRDAAATTVLFSLGAALAIARNTTAVISAPYRDPDQRAQRVGGIDMVDPVASTDYEFFENEDGTGADLTSQLSIVATFGGNSAVLEITNAGPDDGFIPANGLQLRGRGLYDFEPLISDQQDEASVEAFGENSLAYDMPYQSDPENAVDLGQFILALNADEETRIESVTFVANWSDEHVEQAFNGAISDRVSVTAGSIGIQERPHFINGITLSVRMSGLMIVTYDLAPVDTNEYWLLEVDGRSELDETTILGFGLFAPGWILETSELGTDTFLG